MRKTISQGLAIGVALTFSSLGVYSFLRGGSGLSHPTQATSRATLSAQATPASGDSRAGKLELESLQQHLSKKPNHTPVLLRMAQVAREMGKPAEAAQHLRQALQQEPGNREARLELGRALYETGDIGGAIKETQELLSKDPRDVDALYNSGAIYGNMKQDDLARKYWLQAVAIAPGSPSGQLAKQGLSQLSPPQTRLIEAAH